MKTTILQLEPFDDIDSARDKMAWAKSKRLIVVWPDNESVLQRRIDLLLLKRKAEQLGMQIAFVSRNSEILYHAPRLGVPVFKGLQQAQRERWRVPRQYRTPQRIFTRAQPIPDNSDQRSSLPIKPPGPQPIRPWLRLGLFTLGVFSVLAIAIVLLPSAEIQLQPSISAQEMNIAAQAKPGIAEINPAGIVPLRPITVTVEGRGSSIVSGKITLPYKHATGEVVFTNLTDETIQILEGTVVRTAGGEAIRFASTESGTIPAGPGQALTLSVRCLSPGSKGNLPANSIQVIEGLLNTRLSVTNPAPTQGGSEREEPAPTERDRQTLLANLSEELKNTALQELQNIMDEKDLLITNSLEIAKTVEVSFQPADTQPADRLFLNLRLEFTARFIAHDDLIKLAKLVLNSSLPENFEPLSLEPEIEVTVPPSYQENGNATLRLSAMQKIRALIDERQVVQISLLNSPELTKKLLQEKLNIRGEPVITLFPGWWPRLPVLPFRITVTLN